MSKANNPQTQSDNVQYFGATNFQIATTSLSQVATNLFNILMYMVTYAATGGWGLAVMVASQIAAAMRIFDGITDPIVAWFVPKVRTKFGVARPVIFVGWLMEVVSLLGLFNFGAASGSVVLFAVFYTIHVIGYTCLNKGIGLIKLTITNDPQKRPLFQRYNQSFVMIFTMLLTLYRSKYLVPKYGGLKPGAFAEMAIAVVAVGSIMIIVGLFACRRFDNADDFARDYHGATKYNLKDIWNLVVHNRAFLTQMISEATDKLASNTAGNAAIQTLLFGIVISNYGFSGDISIVTTIISLLMIWGVTGMARRRGNKDTYLKWCYASIALSAVTCLFMVVIDPTQISKSMVPTVIFVILYGIQGSFKSATNACVQTMDQDIQDYDFYLHGKFLGPVIPSVANILSKTIDSFSNIILASCLAVLGYVETMPQPGDPTSPALFWITMFLWLGMPALGYLASIIALKWYPLDAKTMVEVQRVNNERRAQNRAEYETKAK